MEYEIAIGYQLYFFQFWFGALPMLLGMWILKRWILD